MIEGNLCCCCCCCCFFKFDFSALSTTIKVGLHGFCFLFLFLFLFAWFLFLFLFLFCFVLFCYVFFFFFNFSVCYHNLDAGLLKFNFGLRCKLYQIMCLFMCKFKIFFPISDIALGHSIKLKCNQFAENCSVKSCSI